MLKIPKFTVNYCESSNLFMKRHFILIACIFSLFSVQSQTWFGQGGTIPDDGTPVIFPISISGLSPATLDTIHGLAAIGINILHPYDSDLLIALIAPDGTTITLSAGNGWDGDNYIATDFTDTASVSILEGTPPFTGYFRPQEMLGSLNNGQNGNGIWNLYILDTYAYADQGQLLNWSITFSPDVTGPFAFSSSNLPIVLIDTYGQQIPDDPKIHVGMKIIDNGPGIRNYVTDTAAYDGYAGIEIRGSSSQMFPKKSYGFETWDADGNEFETSLLGMPEETDWILNASYTDKSLSRNGLAYQLFANMGHYATRYKHVEVCINGIYKGVYIFSEKIKRDANRVNIAKLKPDQNGGDPLTGGYIFKIDKPTGTGGGEGWYSLFPPPGNPAFPILFQYEFPKAADITDMQKSYIADYVNTFESALAGPNFGDPNLGFRQYADEGTFIDYFLVNEISKNVDGYRLSTFIHKQRESLGGKIRLGPVWDYDIAFHNANYYNGEDYTGWSYLFPFTDDVWQVPFWWQRLMQDSTFCNNVQCRWVFLRNNLLSDAWFDQYIDSIAANLNEAQQRNFTVWPILGNYVWPNPWPYPETYAEEIGSLKNWIHNRLAWLDANLPGTCYTVNNQQIAAAQIPGITIFPNPASNYTRILIRLEAFSKSNISILDTEGKMRMRYEAITNNEGIILYQPDLRNLSPGIYFVHVSSDSATYFARLVKQ